MFIQTEDTPNPSTIKFLPGKEVMNSGTADFTSFESTEKSPLARRLIEIDGVDGVFLGSDFISITKANNFEWFSLKPSVLGKIMEEEYNKLKEMSLSESVTMQSAILAANAKNSGGSTYREVSSTYDKDVKAFTNNLYFGGDKTKIRADNEDGYLSIRDGGDKLLQQKLNHIFIKMILL